MRLRTQQANLRHGCIYTLEDVFMCINASVDEPGGCVTARRTDAHLDQRVDGVKVTVIDAARHHVALSFEQFPDRLGHGSQVTQPVTSSKTNEPRSGEQSQQRVHQQYLVKPCWQFWPAYRGSRAATYSQWFWQIRVAFWEQYRVCFQCRDYGLKSFVPVYDTEKCRCGESLFALSRRIPCILSTDAETLHAIHIPGFLSFVLLRMSSFSAG